MAEAHEAVAFSFSVDPEGKLNVNVNHAAIRVVWRSGVRTWKKRIARFANSIRNGLFPAKPSSWLYIVVLMFLASLRGWDFSQYGVSSIEYVCNWFGQERYVHLTSCAIFSLLVWFAGIVFWQSLLRLLFSYQSWLYEPLGRISMKTRIWLGLVRCVKAARPRLYGYQPFLPKLPLPSLKETLARHLKSVRPLLNDQEFEEMQKLTEEFRRTLGFKLQFFLWLKSWWASNYVTDWWEEYIYLAGRGPIMVNSNFYGLDTVMHGKTKATECESSQSTPPILYKALAGMVKPSARAANVVYWIIQHRRGIDRQELKPIFLNHTVPLCSLQYERQFNTTRTPDITRDHLQHFLDSYHICVYHKGRYFKCYFYHQGRLLTPIELQVIFDQILKDKSEPAQGEEHLAALTAGERKPWALAREKFFSKGINKPSLDAIEKAAFCLSFDDEEYSYDPHDDSKLNHFARAMLHGQGHDRWFDKSINLVISKNARVGFNAEHSWADAPIMAHLWEYVLGMDAISCIRPDGICGYTDDGNCIGFVENAIPGPIRLKWDLTAECCTVIENSLNCARNLMDDVDLHVLVHNEFGKGAMKKCRISPDAFIQLSMQLSIFKLTGKFFLTYESSMTRLFREGRTETVRSCSSLSCAFVRTMLDSKSTKKDRIESLKAAAEYHQQLCRDAMCGRGIDRHLFSLYVMDQYLKTNSPFLKKVISEPWRLSTSQTPTNQTSIMDGVRHADLVSAGGGFGPVADDGYGVSYIIVGENILFFHISSKRSCPTTDSFKMAQSIRESLKEMKELFDSPTK